jgi:hypothetical protein
MGGRRLLPDTRVSTCPESFGFSCASPHANRLRGSSEACVAMRVSISAHHSPCLVRTCSAFLYFGAVNSVSLSARYWNYGAICGRGTVGWARTTDLLFHSKRSPELHGTSWCSLRRKNIQVNHILSAYLSLTPLHFVSGYLTSLGTFLEPFDGA